jgi:hypothetical protein
MNKKFLGGLCVLALSIGLLQSQSSVTPVLAQNSGEGLAGSAPYDFESMKPIAETPGGGVITRLYGCVRTKQENVKCVYSLTGDKQDADTTIDNTFYVSTAGQVFGAIKLTFALPDEKEHTRRTIFSGISTAFEAYFTIPTTVKTIPVLQTYNNRLGNFRVTNVAIR